MIAIILGAAIFLGCAGLTKLPQLPATRDLVVMPWDQEDEDA